MSEAHNLDPSGTLFGVGVGPGDPELLTLKAIRVIQTATVIAAPCAEQDGESYALRIVRELLRPEQLVTKLHFPMARSLAVRRQHRQRAAETVAAQLAAGHHVAFLTEGDPLLYSTFLYLLAHMPHRTTVEVVPGITSIHAAAAQAQQPLVQGEQRLAVLPATVENLEQLPAILELFDTVVLLKLHRTFDRVLRALDALGMAEKALLVDQASHPEGRVVRDVRVLQESEAHYLSLLILSKSGEVKDAG